MRLASSAPLPRRFALPAVVLSALPVAVALLASTAWAEDIESDAVYVPAADARGLHIRNALGAVRVQGWDRPEIRIIAHKHAGVGGMLARLRVRVDLGEGQYRVTTGYYLSDETFNALPLAGAGIDLVIDAPRAVALTVAAFRGDVEASGFRHGAKLSSQQGRIRVADLEGPVDTRALDGDQWFEAIRGSLATRVVDGDVDIADVRGAEVEASVLHGHISARDVEAPLVRLHTTVGTVLFVGLPRPGAQLDFATHEGDIKLVLREAPFRLFAAAPSLRAAVHLDAGSEPGLFTHAPPGDPAAHFAHLRAASWRGSIDLTRVE